MALHSFPIELNHSVETMDSSKVAEATFRVAKSFNEMYRDRVGHQIVDTEPEIRRSRMMLTAAVGKAIQTGLELLGIETIDSM